MYLYNKHCRAVAVFRVTTIPPELATNLGAMMKYIETDIPECTGTRGAAKVQLNLPRKSW